MLLLYLSIFQLVLLVLASRCITQNNHLAVGNREKAAVILGRSDIDDAVRVVALEYGRVNDRRTIMYGVCSGDE